MAGLYAAVAAGLFATGGATVQVFSSAFRYRSNRPATASRAYHYANHHVLRGKRAERPV